MRHIVKTSIISAALIASSMLFGAISSDAQTVKSQVVENGGTGPYKAMVAGDASLEKFTIYRPADLKAAVNAEGKLPVILYGNGGCQNSSIEIRYFLSELASYGYVAVAIGPYDEDDFFAHWKDVMSGMYPENKRVILANGEEVPKPTPEEVRQREENMQKMIAQMRAEAEKAAKEAAKKGKKNAAPAPAVPVARQATYAKQLLEAMDWLTDQNAQSSSEYYHMLDLEHVAVMGQSCGGAQALAVAHDPRISTCVILNSGIGDMEMQGCTQEQLKNLHTPMFYLIGGPSDVAYENAAKDFRRIENVPVVMANTIDGHEGTYYEKSGGLYAIAVRGWLDWQLKGDISQSAQFLSDKVFQLLYPEWEVVRKNF
ncbi:MAG: hypothetical protein IJ202_03180 [Bacteroidales bacterium]|nr:hypothetical protein [Bacteroidales bacterium]MBQ9710809.1 hypothetical protein [Bacteroidales bacterium]